MDFPAWKTTNIGAFLTQIYGLRGFLFCLKVDNLLSSHMCFELFSTFTIVLFHSATFCCIQRLVFVFKILCQEVALKLVTTIRSFYTGMVVEFETH